MSCTLCNGKKCKGECATEKSWTLSQARSLCFLLEEIAPKFGAHIGLTGGVLYREGNRKDCDIVVYRHGGREEPIDRVGFSRACCEILGMTCVRGTGRVYKMLFVGKQVDFLFHDTAEAATANPNDDGSSA
jgi:hypothetical protein